MTILHRRSRAAQLLEKLLATGLYEPASIASELVITEAALHAYRTGEIPMRLEHQLCLALFVINHVPALARHGYQLRGQVAAGLSFVDRQTATHASPPPTARW